MVSRNATSRVVPIFYYSASGNTKYCAELVKRGFNDKDVEINLVRIKNVRELPFPEEGSSPPALGLAFPVYEFMVPRIILIWLNKLPPAQQKTPSFIIDTSGGRPCNAAGVAMDLLKKKNYDPLGVLEVPTPTAEPFFDNKFYPAGWTREILDRCYFFGVLIAKRLQKENNRFVDLNLCRFRFPKLTNWAYRYFIQGESSTSGLIKFDSNKCNNCGACERACPMAAIDIQRTPSPINSSRCMFCATCVRTCPTHAIKISYRPKKTPPSAQTTPKSRPGYVPPDKFQGSKLPKISSRYIRLLLKMFKIQ